ncbi:hypothetical protein SSP24_63560 [Streptomyces spinoverrucosus]|uniref:Lipoprotein n=1 Tax=Streptomyces spinoverrucosus TaxID=284043 RepID=A0A4Y3VSD2_9ACTN|nr:hypothetical protein [Streptomyces spinoverrucosus]GEC08701.1 hypothetical protein SSP24_63560 [Streptomyces spinoverrucosus]GHB53583.1 hypothetical protein GCM10010397_24540 [Streptomyces spinoverrucosus]
MRIRATVATVTGALALSVLAAPAVHAAPGEPYKLNVTFSHFKITKAIKVGATGHYSTTVTYKLTHGTDVDIKAKDFVTNPVLYRGSLATPSSVRLTGVKPAACTVNSATTATCTGKIDIYPGEDLLNSDAGTWKGAAVAIAYNGQDPAGEEFDISKVGHADKEGLGTTLVRRAAQLTVNASPEPVQKGKTLTVTGKLTRANWETGKYAGYATQPVELQFRKKNATTYTKVKTLKTNTRGDLKTTVKASVDGYYRFVFKGTTTATAVNAAGDFVDVK